MCVVAGWQIILSKHKFFFFSFKFLTSDSNFLMKFFFATVKYQVNCLEFNRPPFFFWFLYRFIKNAWIFRRKISLFLQFVKNSVPRDTTHFCYKEGLNKNLSFLFTFQNRHEKCITDYMALNNNVGIKIHCRKIADWTFSHSWEIGKTWVYPTDTQEICQVP